VNPIAWGLKTKIIAAIISTFLAGSVVLAIASSNPAPPKIPNPSSTPSVEGTASAKLACEEKTESKDLPPVVVPFQTRYQNDNTLDKGMTRVVQAGVIGEKVTTEITVTHRDCTTATSSSERITKNPVDQIVANGNRVVVSSCGAPSNPWRYNFCGGSVISDPPTSFCNYFSCIPSFWSSTNGYVEQCSDGMFSHSGGRRGSCSYHGGNYRPLYQ
jgi:hypothetical protein